MPTFIAMNHFQVNPARADEFEKHWTERKTYLHEVPGFLHFALLRGDEAGAYISHSTWASRDTFEAWTTSEAFRKAHAQARTPEGILVGHPKLATFEAMLEQEA
jgi:heme-degrading monooxygenase HmoA